MAYSSNIGTIKVAERSARYRLASYLIGSGWAKVGVGSRGDERHPDPRRQLVRVEPPLDLHRAGHRRDARCRWPRCTRPSPTAACGSSRGWSRDASTPTGAFHRPGRPPTRRVVQRADREDRGRACSPTASRSGPARPPRSPGYWVAGKTGTARSRSPTAPGTTTTGSAPRSWVRPGHRSRDRRRGGPRRARSKFGGSPRPRLPRRGSVRPGPAASTAGGATSHPSPRRPVG